MLGFYSVACLLGQCRGKVWMLCVWAVNMCEFVLTWIGRILCSELAWMGSFRIVFGWLNFVPLSFCW